MGEKYSIGKIAESVGMSRQTIRNYEAQGILDAERNETNQYREYGSHHSKYLFQAKLYKSIGFGLEDISSLLYRNDYSQVEEALQQRVDECQEEIARQLNILSEAKEYRDDLLWAVNHLNTMQIKDERKSFYLVLRKSIGAGILDKNDQYDKRVILSHKYLPHIRQGFKLRKENSQVSLRYGTWIEEQHMLARMVEELNPEHIQDDGLWLSYTVRPSQAGDWGETVYKQVEEYLGKRQCKLVSDLYGKAIYVSGKDNPSDIYQFFGKIE